MSNMARPGEQRRRRNLQPTAPDREREHDAGERSQERGRAPDPGATGDGGGGRVRRRGRREWLRVGSSTRHQRARVAAEGGRRRGSSHRCGASDPSRVEKRRFSWGNTPPAAAGFSACWRVPAAAPAQRPRVPLEPADRQSLLAGARGRRDQPPAGSGERAAKRSFCAPASELFLGAGSSWPASSLLRSLLRQVGLRAQPDQLRTARDDDLGRR